MVSRPKGKSIVSSIWIYKIQHAVYGNIVGYKAIFVAQDLSQKEGIDYEETFAPVMSQVYIKQPLGFETRDRQAHVCKLKKALYDLKRHTWDNT